MRVISDDEQQSYRRKSWLPFGFGRRRVKGFVAAPPRCPASPASPLRALTRRRSERGPRDFCHGLLVSRVRSSFTKSLDLSQDDVGVSSPYEGLWVLIILVQVFLDRLFQAAHALERPTPNPFLGDLAEPPLHLVHPRPTSRGEVEVISRMPRKPANYFRRLMGSVVV